MTDFKTNDTNLAAALSASGLPMVDMRKEEGNRVYFVFRGTEKVHHASNRFWGRSLSVDAKTLTEELKTLKHRITNV